MINENFVVTQQKFPIPVWLLLLYVRHSVPHVVHIRPGARYDYATSAVPSLCANIWYVRTILYRLYRRIRAA